MEVGDQGKAEALLTLVKQPSIRVRQETEFSHGMSGALSSPTTYDLEFTYCSSSSSIFIFHFFLYTRIIKNISFILQGGLSVFCF